MSSTPTTEQTASVVAEADPPLAYSIMGAADKAGIGRSKTIEEINAGRLKARKVGRRTIILRDDLVAWLAALPSRHATAPEFPPLAGAARRLSQPRR